MSKIEVAMFANELKEHFPLDRPTKRYDTKHIHITIDKLTKTYLNKEEL